MIDLKVTVKDLPIFELLFIQCLLISMSATEDAHRKICSGRKLKFCI